MGTRPSIYSDGVSRPLRRARIIDCSCEAPASKQDSVEIDGNTLLLEVCAQCGGAIRRRKLTQIDSEGNRTLVRVKQAFNVLPKRRRMR